MPGSPMGEQANAEGQPSQSPSEAQAQAEKSNQASNQISKSGSRKGGEPMENQKPMPGDLSIDKAAEGDSSGEKDKQDADAAKRKFEDEPWIAKLPPSLRTAIQAKSRNKAPRGYEERLKRYFESVD
jgi:hypothetical protein